MIRMQKIAPVAIRRAGMDDAVALISLEQDALGGVFGKTGLTDWSSLFAESGVFTYLAEDTEPFGVIAVGNPRETMHRDGNTGEVIAWYLHPRYQESGFGKKLLVHGLSVIKRRNFERAIIRIPEVAVKAIQSVQSLQFEQTGVESMGDVNLLTFSLTLDNFF